LSPLTFGENLTMYRRFQKTSSLQIGLWYIQNGLSYLYVIAKKFNNINFYVAPVIASLIIDNYWSSLKSNHQLLLLCKNNLLLLATYKHISSFLKENKKTSWIMVKMAYYVICVMKWYVLWNQKRENQNSPWCIGYLNLI
jgi:hypothetical protein